MEPTTNEIDMTSVAKVAGRVNLESVKLLGCSCRQRTQSPDGPKAFDIKRTPRFVLGEDHKSIGVAIRFTLKAFGKDDPQTDENAFLTIGAEFFLLYSISNANDLDDNAFKGFAEVNGTYNAWPYWREFVQSVTSRMDLPPLTIPVFRIQCAPPKEPTTQEAETEITTEK